MSVFKSCLPKEGTVLLTDSLYEHISLTLRLMDKVCGVIHETCALAATQLSLLSGNKERERERISVRRKNGLRRVSWIRIYESQGDDTYCS